MDGFPKGGAEPEDMDPYDTACRELVEKTDLDLDELDVFADPIVDGYNAAYYVAKHRVPMRTEGWRAKRAVFRPRPYRVGSVDDR